MIGENEPDAPLFSAAWGKTGKLSGRAACAHRRRGHAKVVFSARKYQNHFGPVRNNLLEELSRQYRKFLFVEWSAMAVGRDPIMRFAVSPFSSSLFYFAAIVVSENYFPVVALNDSGSAMVRVHSVVKAQDEVPYPATRTGLHSSYSADNLCGEERIAVRSEVGCGEGRRGTGQIIQSPAQFIITIFLFVVLLAPLSSFPYVTLLGSPS
jgi:hypothetical protein